MNALTEHLMLERDHTPRMSDDVPADGLYVVIDGSPADAEEFGDRFVVCLCDDSRHTYRDRYTSIYAADEERAALESAAWRGGHVVPVRLYLVVGEVSA